MVHIARELRGTVLQTENKTPGPVAYEYARRIYATLLSKKTAQGYVLQPPVSAAAPSAPVIGSQQRPLRPVPLPVTDVGALISDPDWWMQENYRGWHIVISKMSGEIIATDGDGAIVPLPEALTMAVARVPLRCMLEGVLQEAIFTAFDMPQCETTLYRSLPYDVRLAGVRNLLPENEPHLIVAATAMELTPKVELLQRLRKEGKAGFVLKRRNGTARGGHDHSVRDRGEKDGQTTRKVRCH